MKKILHKAILAALATAAVLSMSACGGLSDDPPPVAKEPPARAGIYFIRGSHHADMHSPNFIRPEGGLIR